MIARMMGLAAGFTLALLVAACSRDSRTAKKTETPPVSIDTLALRNATYLSDYAPEGSVKLTDGAYVDSVNMMSVRIADRLDGDLNGDGAQDAAVFLTTNAGAGSVFLDLVAMLSDGGTPRFVGKVALGDRVGLDSLYMEHRDIVAHLTTHAEGDPLCCPTKKVVRRYAVEGGRLIETE